MKGGKVQDLPSGKIPDGIFLQAGLAVFALLCKQKHRCAFQILPRIKQFMRYCQIKSTPKGVL